MKIIIIGAGQTGALLAELISKEMHDVLIIDENKERVETITNQLNVSGLYGNGAALDVLLKAGADLADVVVALTPSDETNLLACAMAKQCGTRFCIARMDNPMLSNSKESYSSKFHIDYIVTPKEDTAKEIARHIGLPGTVRAEGFFSSDATMIRVNVDEDSRLNKMAILDVKSFMETELLVGTVVRKGKACIPKASFVMEAGDQVSMIIPNRNLMQIMTKLNLVRGSVKNVLIIGGGVVAYYLAQRLLQEKKKVTILELDQTRCIELQGLLPEAKIACVERIDAGVLKQEGIQSADVCVSLTGRDDTNLVISMFAWSCGIESVITKVKAPSYEHLLNKVNIDITISPSVITVDNIISFIRNKAVHNAVGNDIDCMYRFAGGMAEALEFTAYERFSKRDIPFKDSRFKLKDDTIIAVIIRNDEAIIPDGNTSIQTGDKVVVLTRLNSKFLVLEDILA